MIDILFVTIILVQAALFGWYIYETQKTNNKLINSLMSRNTQELVNATLADQTKIKPEVPDRAMNDLVATDELSDQQFDEFIKTQV